MFEKDVNAKKVMGKKGNIIGSDGFQRLNFLYQACLLSLDAVPFCPQLSSLYGSCMVSIGKKLQLKMDSSLKRTMCRGCKGLLVPGKTATVQIQTVPCLKKKKNCKRKQVKIQNWKCTRCLSKRTFVLKPGFVLWSDRTESFRKI